LQDIWTEKYRPKRLEEVVGQNEVVSRLRSIVKSGSIPHFLFAGPAGTGKTTCALALAREVFGEDDWKNNSQELNASDERGIQIVRTKIKSFARAAPLGGADFKIIFLDEADSLTQDAQAALRRTMEKYSSTCRFILSCNYSSRIIPPIQSRCSVLRFPPLRDDDIRRYIDMVCEKEGLNLTIDGFESLLYIGKGDLRKIMNVLQVAASYSRDITSDNLYETASAAKPEDITELLELPLGGDFKAGRDKLEYLLTEGGLSGEDILSQMHRELFNLDIREDLRVRLMSIIGEIDFRLVEGADERIQLETLLAHIQLIGTER